MTTQVGLHISAPSRIEIVRPTDILAFLAREARQHEYRRLSACAAYATRIGVSLLRNVLPDHKDLSFRWLLGLDDYITEPEALLAAAGAINSELRVAGMLPKCRFHPKLYIMDRNPGFSFKSVYEDSSLSYFTKF